MFRVVTTVLATTTSLSHVSGQWTKQLAPGENLVLAARCKREVKVRYVLGFRVYVGFSWFRVSGSVGFRF